MIQSSYPAGWLRQVANPASLISLRANLIAEWHGLRCEEKLCCIMIFYAVVPIHGRLARPGRALDLGPTKCAGNFLMALHRTARPGGRDPG